MLALVLFGAYDSYLFETSSMLVLTNVGDVFILNRY